MLIEFSVGNFRSIRDTITLSLIATTLDSKNTRLGIDNVVKVNDKLSLLRSAVIYGANASGKSNVIKAFNFFKHFVYNSARESVAGDPISTEPYLLRSGMPEEPSHFEVVFLNEGVQYRYGFEVTTKAVVREWLFQAKSNRESTLFTRDGEDIHIPSHSPFREGRGLQERVRPNALFISVVAQFNGKISLLVQDWISRKCGTLSADNDISYMGFTELCIQEGINAHIIIKFLQNLSLDFIGLSVMENTPEQITPSLDQQSNSIQDDKPKTNRSFRRPGSTILTRYIIRDDSGNIIREEDFPMLQMESQGTKKLIALCGPLFEVLTNGRILFLDEIDARLHPLITRAIVRLFHSEETNPKGAQLICATHDTNLLNGNIFRRDQVFFTEKDQDGTHLYSLADFKIDGKRVRSDSSFEEPYIEGRFGAIPYLGDLSSLLRENQESDTPAIYAQPTTAGSAPE